METPEGGVVVRGAANLGAGSDYWRKLARGGKWTFAAACFSDCFKPSIASIAAFTAVRNYV